MAFILKLFGYGGDKKHVVESPWLTRDNNPEQTWEILSELGDGAYGKVYKVILLTTLLQCHYMALYYSKIFNFAWKMYVMFVQMIVIHMALFSCLVFLLLIFVCMLYQAQD